MIKLVELGEQSAELNASELKWFNKQIESLQKELNPRIEKMTKKINNTLENEKDSI